MRKLLAYIFLACLPLISRAQCSVFTAPWSDDFESWTVTQTWSSHLCWNNLYITSVDWNCDSIASTPTINTGPDFAHSGNKYMYLETSDTSSSADLETPTIEIGGLSNPHLRFWYHMYGADMGELSVYVTDDSGQTWTTIWTISGQQHLSGNSPWTREVVDLSSFSSVVKVRFHGTDINSGSAGDMAIDDISFFDCTPTFDTISAHSCGYYVAPSGKLLHNAGNYQDTITNTQGCDSILTIKLTTSNQYIDSTVSSCTYISPSGALLTTSGVYSDTLTSSQGCDSVITIDFTSNSSSTSLSVSACNFFITPSGVQLKTGGIYYDTISNALGCDSVIAINLDLHFNDDTTITETSCGTPYISESGTVYTSTGNYLESFPNAFGCDSLVFLEVTVAPSYEMSFDSIFSCGSYITGVGNVYAATGVYYETLTTVHGCDSNILYNITINSVDSEISMSTNDAGYPILMANQAGATYQWVNCDANYAPFLDSTNQTFTGMSNGNYACIITANGCVDTSDCITALNIEPLSQLEFKLYPNPSTGQVFVELSDLDNLTKIEVINAMGQIVYSEYASGLKSVLMLDHLSAGFYSVSASNSTKNIRRQLVLE